MHHTYLCIARCSYVYGKLQAKLIYSSALRFVYSYTGIHVYVCTYVCIVCIVCIVRPRLSAHIHTYVLDEIADKVRELDK